MATVSEIRKVREKSGEMKIVKIVREESGNLEKKKKVREKSDNFDRLYEPKSSFTPQVQLDDLSCF